MGKPLSRDNGNEPVNELDARTLSQTEKAPVPLIVKVYGILCALSGFATLPSIFLFFSRIITAILHHSTTVAVGDDYTLSVSLVIVGIILSSISSAALIAFGVSLVKSERRNAALLSYVLIAFTVVELGVDIMLEGMGPYLLRPLVQLVILIALSVTVDPTLRQERELQRRLRDMLDRDAAAEGMLGRDETGEGYIKLNFFNLFWVFVVCSILGLILEDIWHMVFVEPGVYQDRAGMLFGPFSPIYGVGAVLMTMVLNRFYNRNWFVIFLVSAVLGGAFETFAGWFWQSSFGIVSWNYSHITIFGLPDPIVLLTAGRACTQMTCLWGIGGLLWIKFALPHLLRIINLIPWKWRYSFTVICTVFMAVDVLMTMQSLDFWFQRVSGIQQDTPVAAFYAEHFDDKYMQNRFQSMTIHPKKTGRVNPDQGE